MARGWESKSIEAQQEATQAEKKMTRALTREEADSRNERTSLMMARTQALADLQRACAAGHRAMLERAIADLDRRIAALTPSSTSRSQDGR